ncbi:MAG: hypothetical protein LLG03_14075 [Planctomycetaceae bacterium]|nr:hypothetical protein [Planctomycetaceae bacterium]
MTARAIIAGLIGALFIGTVGYFNDQVPRVNYFVGNHFPIIVFFPLVLIGLINPLLRSVRLRPAEMALAAALMLVACNIPGSGMLRFWSRNVAMPMHAYRSMPDWQKARVLDRVNPAMLTNGGVYDDAVNQKLLTGGASVPWAAWERPISVWAPIIALVGIASICMALIVHRTWSRHDRLPYPIAQLAESMIESGQDGGGSIFSSKLFWLGACTVLGIHLVNGANLWADNRLVNIPLSLNVNDIFTLFSEKGVVWGYWAVGWPYGQLVIWPTALAFACFVASDVSFALGISPLALTAVTTLLFGLGLPTTSSTMEGGIFPWAHAGSFFAIALVLVYLGRRNYWHIARQAITFIPSRESRPYEAWAFRGLVVAVAALVLLLSHLGLSWPFAILVIAMILTAFLVMARINAESGLILMETWWQPISVLMGLFGIKALGLGNYAIIAMLGLQFTINARECLMPLAVNAVRICDMHRVSPGRVGLGGSAAFVLVLAAAIPFSLYVDYKYGLQRGESFPVRSAPQRNFNNVALNHNRMSSEERLASDSFSSLQRFTHMKPDKTCLAALAAGMAIVLIISALRMRFTWWPLHPILFLFWGTWAMGAFAFSFLVGWTLKLAATRFGVRHATLKTFMIGVIAGDLAGGALWMIVGAIYWAVTGEAPKRYLVFPGG